MKNIFIIVFMILAPNLNNDISKLQSYLMDKKNINIYSYERVMIINSTGCANCNMLLDKLYTELSDENHTDLVIYSVNSMQNYILRDSPNTYYIKGNLSLRFFDCTESIIIYKKEDSFSYETITPDNVDSVLNLRR